MRYFDVLDVREREGKKPAFMAIFTIYVNDNGKMSLYNPVTGRFHPIKEQQQRGGQQPAQESHTAPPPQMPGTEPLPPSGRGYVPPDDSDVPF